MKIQLDFEQPMNQFSKPSFHKPILGNFDDHARYDVIKKLIWAYFFLLIFEGVLRKWIFPALSSPLLFIRDPIVLLIYVLAISKRIYPYNKFVLSGSVIAFFSLVAGLIVLRDFPSVALFGFRANFLQMPLIFIVPKVFDITDVRKVGYWTLLLATPLAVLMAFQFQAPSGSWINAGAGEGAKQITLGGERIRAAATFSFITGPVYFYALVAAFLVDSQFVPKNYPRWLLVSASLALGVAMAVSGSRSLIAFTAIVGLCGLVTGFFLQTRLFGRTLQMLFGVLFIALFLSQIPVFSEGFAASSDRIQGASLSEGGSNGVFQSRVLDDYTRPFELLIETPWLGYGLGVGTVGGTNLLTEQSTSQLGRDAERELARNVLESGPVLGLLFVLWRFNLALSIVWAALRCACLGNSLPFLLSGIAGLITLNGLLGQTTVLGFAVFVGGICLASMRVPSHVDEKQMKL